MTDARKGRPGGKIEMYEDAKALVHGKTWGDWSVEWWRWLIKIPKGKNPSNDNTGKYSRLGQRGPVFFLAGTMKGSAIRSCNIPKGKSVFCPITIDEESFAEKQAYLNFSKKPEGIFDKGGERAMMNDAKKDIDNMISIEATFDKGTDYEVSLLTGRLSQYRVTTEPFDLKFPQDNIFDGKPGISRAVSDGYCLFLKPFPKGAHTLHFRGIEDDYQLDVTYNITVK